MRYSLILLSLIYAISYKCLAIEIYAHRGGAGLSPENTLEAIQTSLSLGVDVIDFDIGLTADKVVVLYHDTTLNPDLTRNAKLEWLSLPGPALKQITYKSLQQFDVGMIKPDSPYASLYPLQINKARVQIPDLRTALQVIKSSNKPVRLQIEIKTDPDPNQQSPQPEEIVPALISVLREERMADRVEVHSFDWRNLILLQQLAPEINTSYLSDNELLNQNNYVIWLADNDVKALNYSYPSLIRQLGGRIWCPNYQDLTQDLLQEAHQLGLKVNVWTVDEPSDMLKMIALGVDGIISNRPDILKGLLAATRQCSKYACT